MAAWVRIDADIEEHPKVWQLANLCGVSVEECVGHLAILFGKVAKFNPDGRLDDVSDLNLEKWASWHGERSLFAQSFREHWLKNGVITGWAKRNGKLLERAEKDRDRHRAQYSEDSPQRKGEPSAEKSVLRNGTLRDTKSTSSSARDLLRARCAQPERFDAVCDSLLQGIGLPNMKPATAHDIEIACVDWLASAHATTDQPSPRLFRKFVEKIMQDHATPQTGNGARRAPKLSPGKQAYINAGIALDALGIYDETTSSSHAQDTK